MEEMKCPLVQLLKDKSDMLVIPCQIDLTITFVDLAAPNQDHQKMLQNVPTVRVVFQE